MDMLGALPKIPWRVDAETVITAQDFTVVYQLSKDWFERKNIDFEYYYLKAGQTVEDIAEAMYGDRKLYWVILIANRIVDVRAQWFLTDNQLLNFTFDKYYVKVYNNEGNWDDEKSAEITSEYIRWSGTADNDYFYEPLNSFDENGDPIKLLPNHFETERGDWIPHLAGGFPVSHLDYEISENLKRRYVRLPSIELANEMKNALSNA